MTGAAPSPDGKLLYLARQWRSAMEAHSAAAREARMWAAECERLRRRADDAEAALGTAVATAEFLRALLARRDAEGR